MQSNDGCQIVKAQLFFTLLVAAFSSKSAIRVHQYEFGLHFHYLLKSIGTEGFVSFF
jgi:hypothetical protein